MNPLYEAANNEELQNLANCYPKSHDPLDDHPFTPIKDGGRTYGVIALDGEEYTRKEQYWNAIIWRDLN
jgi:hypothetical protein